MLLAPVQLGPVVMAALVVGRNKTPNPAELEIPQALLHRKEIMEAVLVVEQVVAAVAVVAQEPLEQTQQILRKLLVMAAMELPLQFLVHRLLMPEVVAAGLLLLAQAAQAVAVRVDRQMVMELPVPPILAVVVAAAAVAAEMAATAAPVLLF